MNRRRMIRATREEVRTETSFHKADLERATSIGRIDSDPSEDSITADHYRTPSVVFTTQENKRLRPPTTIMKFSSLHDLYVEQLKDLHSAETQLTKALPKMAAAATAPELKSAFTEHLEQTKEQLQRLNQIGEKLGKSLGGHTCAAMKGLIEEGSEWMEEDAEPEVMDAGLIAAAQRVEHYEIAGYGTVHNFSELLGEREATKLLAETLEEEEDTDEKLTTLAQSINVEAKA
jgi:ferritin-like metal-binding protein YciE